MSLPTMSFLRIFSLNRLFLTIANMTYSFGTEFPKDTTKVFQLFGNEPSSKHARVSLSSERPATNYNCAIIPLKSFRFSAIDCPSLSFEFISFQTKKIFFLCVLCLVHVFEVLLKSVRICLFGNMIVENDVYPLANDTQCFLLQLLPINI